MIDIIPFCDRKQLQRSLPTEPLDEWNQWRYALFLRLFSLNRRQPGSPKNLVSLPKAVSAAMDSLTPQTVRSSPGG
ncbi:hypothetical protein [Microseira sp. BLCC-F43]|uniref:hypothetical protein n=1 Tax=Microseira sp. BLCC-F43 TaxID=3153602 RepID=UPI0035B6F023